MNKIIKILAILISALLFVFSLAGCTGKHTGSYETLNSYTTEGTSTPTEKIKITGIYLSNKALSLSVGDIYTIVASILPVNATDETVVWTSSDEKVAVVDDGKITAKAPGTAKITAKVSNSKTAVCTVKVVKKIIVPYHISLNENLVTLNVGDSFSLAATIDPSNASDKSVTWTSSNNIIVTVDENGKITAVSSGSATITAVTSNKLVTTCTVRVDDIEIDPNLVGLTATNINLKVGGTFKLSASIIPSNATDKTIIWDSNNDAIASVYEGNITAHSPGVATITATTSNGRTADCIVTVSK